MPFKPALICLTLCTTYGLASPLVQEASNIQIAYSGTALLLSGTNATGKYPKNFNTSPAGTSMRSAMPLSPISRISSLSTTYISTAVLTSFANFSSILAIQGSSTFQLPKPALTPSIVISTVTSSGSMGFTTQLTPVIVANKILSLPSITNTPSIDANGIDASSTAGSFQTYIIWAQRAVQSWTASPSNSASKTQDINAVKSAGALGAGFQVRLGNDGGGGRGTSGDQCSSGGFVLALMHRVSCAINSLDKLGQDLGKDVKEIEDDLTNVTKSVQPLIPDHTRSSAGPSQRC